MNRLKEILLFLTAIVALCAALVLLNWLYERHTVTLAIGVALLLSHLCVWEHGRRTGKHGRMNWLDTKE